MSEQVTKTLADLNASRAWLFTMAFVSIGLEFNFQGFKQAGWRPVLVYGLATVGNTLIALLVAYCIFGLSGF